MTAKPQLKPISISLYKLDQYKGPKIWTQANNYPGTKDLKFITPDSLSKENRQLFGQMKDQSLEALFDHIDIADLIH